MATVPLTLSGGLDLTTAKVLTAPGTLADCLNYERGLRQGYTRIDGIERFDGQPSVAAYSYARLKYVSGTGSFAPGDAVTFPGSDTGYVTFVTSEAGSQVLYVVFHAAAGTPTIPATLTGPSGTASILSRDPVFATQGTQAVLDAALLALSTTQRAVITTVPGRGGSDIIGGFWFKDREYAVRDLPRVFFEGGYYTEANEGQFVTYLGDTYQILNVRITGPQAGSLTLNPVPGSGSAATPLVAASLVSLPVTGSLDAAYTGVSYSDGLTASGGIAPYTWSVVGDASSIVPIGAVDASNLTLYPQLTDAALYRADSTGWTRIDLGRELAFTGGAAALANFSRDLSLKTATTTTTAYLFPTASEFNGAATTGINADDGVVTALTGAQGDTFVAKGFALSTIPSDAEIMGIEVVIERTSTVGGPATDAAVILLGLTGNSANLAKTIVWPTSLTTATYGGPTDLWGAQGITPATLQAAGFGVQLVVQRSVPATATSGGVDYVKLRVTYVLRGQPVYAWDGSSDVPLTLRHVQILDGDTPSSNAAGYLNVTAAVNASKPRLIHAGEQIRSAAGGTGDLLCTTNGTDVPIFLSGQSELDLNRSKYQFVESNFYGQDDWRAIYGVSGAGPAFYFDGSTGIRIRTQLPARFDLPRHVVRHGDLLGLGYYSGAVIFSAPGNPFEMRAASGASSLEVGDRLTNLLPLTDDTLGVICQKSTYGLRGLTQDTFFKSTISATRGAIEYSAADMGRVLICDGLGVFFADSAQQFGAAERNYISTAVSPWLQPRLQATINSEQSYIRLIGVLPVRAKNQYRLYFADGYVLTLTATEPVEYTIQRYYAPSGLAETEPTPWPIRSVNGGIDSSGRERLFLSFFGGVKEGYVLEIDSGRSFDGAAIPAYLELNPLSVSQAADLKRTDRLFLYGSGYGAASLTLARTVNDRLLDPTQTSALTLGASSDAATLQPRAFRGSVDAPVEGYDTILRFDSSTASEGPHTLQFMNLMVDARGTSRGNTR